MKQPTIALSTMEAEYMTTSHCTKETVWLKQLMVDVGCVQEGLTYIMCDNQRCIALAKNPTHHFRTEHIDVQCHFIKEKLKDQKIYLMYCLMEDIITNVLTNSLASTKAMGLETFDYSQSGSVEGRALDCS